MRHLIFFDDHCGFCHSSVAWILRRDRKKIFAFAPLSGKTASKLSPDLQKEDSLILVENYEGHQKTHLRAKAVFKILLLLGLPWSLLGVFYILPGFLTNPFYRLIAKNRSKLCKLEKRIWQDPRFLP